MGEQEIMSHPNLKPYPPAGDDMKRLVIVLDGPGKDDPNCEPCEEEENSKEVELIAGATIETDGINNCHLIGTQIAEETVSGWGFSYYKIIGDPSMVRSTMMAGEPNPQ